MESEKQIKVRVRAFMKEWLSYAKNRETVKCPVPMMHEADKEYYCRRIIKHENIQTLIDDHNYDALSELRIMEQKRAAIRMDFEQLYRKAHNIPRPNIVSTYKTIAK